MPEPAMRESDLVIPPRSFAHILDRTKGQVSVIVGPNKISLSGTDVTVRWNQQKQRFEPSVGEQALQPFTSAPKGYYVVLTNPAATEKDRSQPKETTNVPACALQTGKRTNTPGPVDFALWPGQSAEIIEGHHLRSNQYLLVRVYNEEEARTNWGNAIIKRQTQPNRPVGQAQSQGGEGGLPGEGGQSQQSAEGTTPAMQQPALQPAVSSAETFDPKQLTMGQTLVIKGTEVSFYIPPTGVEVIPEAPGKYVREAVTLERLEYCILLDESGEKRFVRGPVVVFPEPTESFVTQGNADPEGEGTSSPRKFRALELNSNSGVHVKVIADYVEDGEEHHTGDELFITGAEQPIYYPRPEHAIVRYGDRTIHYAVVVPEGEARYVLNKERGSVDLEIGPTMLLPDPRTEVIVRRVLDQATVDLWFPESRRAHEHNQALARIAAERGVGAYVSSMDVERSMHFGGREERSAAVSAGLVSEEFKRGTTFTAPRTVTLDTKYDGAVAIDVWTGYAILVVDKAGHRRVVKGPETVLLNYDEQLMAFELSTGTPKTDAKLLRTVYLRVLNNRVSDVVGVETSDLCNVSIRLSYRVNFEGDQPERWFAVENYIRFLTEHLRSVIRNEARRHGIENFYGDAINIIRNAVLGEAKDGVKRPGKAFAENGMLVYDVEVLDVAISNPEIARLLVGAQHDTVSKTLAARAEERQLELTSRSEEVKRKIAAVQAETAAQLAGFKIDAATQMLQVRIAELEIEIGTKIRTHAANADSQKTLDAIAQSERARNQADMDQRLASEKEHLEMLLKELEGMNKVVTPQLVAALQAFGDKHLAAKLAESMAPLAMIRNEGVAESLSTLLRGTSLESVIRQFAERGKLNGTLTEGEVFAGSQS